MNIFLVTESYDGEVKVTPCANIESARYIKKQLLDEAYKDKAEHNIKFKEEQDSEDYYEALVHGYYYTIKITEEKVFDINIL